MRHFEEEKKGEDTKQGMPQKSLLTLMNLTAK